MVVGVMLCVCVLNFFGWVYYFGRHVPWILWTMYDELSFMICCLCTCVSFVGCIMPQSLGTWQRTNPSIRNLFSCICMCVWGTYGSYCIINLCKDQVLEYDALSSNNVYVFNFTYRFMYITSNQDPLFNLPHSFILRNQVT